VKDHTLSKKRIGILIVAYNALTTLSKVFKRIPPEVWQEIEEVAVFDDHSQDETYELAVGCRALAGLDKLTIFRNEKNLGYGGNQKRGYQYFMDKGFDAVVLLHGDGQYAPEMLADMYRPIVNGEADAVFGSRMLPDYGGPIKGGMPLYKYAGNKILTKTANWALGMELSEFHSGYRAYNLHALRRLDFSHMTDVFHFDTEIIVKLHHHGFRIREIPIPTYYGTEICRVNGMRYAKDVVRSLWRYKRTLKGAATYPEYQELQIHYPLKHSRHSSHDYCLSLCGRDNDVLDVGCGEGFFAAEASRNGNRVVGIDALEQPRHAEAFADYVQADLDRGMDDALPALRGKRFDVVLLQDVLEHLRDPAAVLDACRNLVKPNGRIVVSVPNVANVTVRLSLLCGRFEYTPRGILDRTHVRFYTRNSARRLLAERGYDVIDEKATVMPVELALGLSPAGRLMKLANSTLALATRVAPGLLGYQTLMVARPRAAASAAPVQPPASHRPARLAG
jgi:2-polyprenyl-3-methyl-5-hydroxy-6-metoxy-1,4-benzoquinol methylase